MWASSVLARLAASSLISSSMASRIAWARSSTSSRLSGEDGVDDMGPPFQRGSIFRLPPIFPVVYKKSTNFRDAHRRWIPRAILVLRRHARCSLSVLRDGPHLCSGLVWKERHVMSICLPDARQLSDEVLQALRLRALRGCELGFTEIEVAELLGLSRETVSRWWTAYAEDGVEALPGERTGRPVGSGRTLIDGQAAWLRTILNQKSPEEVGIASPLWTRRAVADLIRKQFGIDMPVRTVGEYLRRWGYTVKVPRRHAKDQDPEEVRKWLEETYPAIERRAAREGAEIHWC